MHAYLDFERPIAELEAKIDELSKLSESAGGTYTLTRRNGVAWKFDSSGELISVTDRNGNAVTLGYADGIAKKHEAIAAGELPFLRGTYYLWLVRAATFRERGKYGRSNAGTSSVRRDRFVLPTSIQRRRPSSSRSRLKTTREFQ